MLIGTYVRHGSYVTVAVELNGVSRRRASVVLERCEHPGARADRATCEFTTLEGALHHAEALVLTRAGWLGAEAECVAGSPVDRAVARRMFSEPELRRYVHLPARSGGR